MTDTPAPPDLLALARERFKELSAAEKELFTKARKGERVKCEWEDDDKIDPAKAETWGPEKTIRSECLEWLCTDQQAQQFVHRQGPAVQGARIIGQLDLGAANVPFNVDFSLCAIPQGIMLQDAHLKGIFLNNSLVGPIHADRTHIQGPFFLKSSTVQGQIQIQNATINGDLSCTGARFDNANDVALLASEASIKGSIFLRENFQSKGGIHFPGAEIKGDLDCTGAQLESQGIPLGADGATIKGCVYLNTKFYAQGEVRLVGADIGGDLDCSCSRFDNPGGIALGADRIVVKGAVFLDRDFHAIGGVKLAGSVIDSDLTCSNGRFANPGLDAFSVDKATIKGNVFLDEGFHATGTVRFIGAEIRGNMRCNSAWFESPDGLALAADSLTVNGFVGLRNGFQAQGALDFTRATVHGSFQYHGLKNPQNASLSLEYATLGVLVDEVASWPAPGNLRLHGLTYKEIHHASPRDAATRKRWLALQRQPPETRRERRRWDLLQDHTPQPYEHLASVLRNSGDSEEAKRILEAKTWGWMRMQTWKRFWPLYDYFQPQFTWITARKGKPRFPWTTLLKAPFNALFLLCYFFYYCTLGFGYRPLRPLYYLGSFFLVGWLVFSQAAGHQAMTKAQAFALGHPSIETHLDIGPPSYPEFSPFAYAIDTLVPFINLHQEEYWLPEEKCEPYDMDILGAASIPFCGRWLRWFLWTYICLGWIFTGLLIIGITGLLQRRSE